LDTRPVGRPPFTATALAKPPLPPRFAFMKTPVWKHAEPVTEAAFGELVEALGENVTEVELGESYGAAIDLHKIIMDVEMAHNLRRDYEQGAASMSPVLRELIERGRAHKAIDYARALASAMTLRAGIDETFNEFDAILTPAAPGEAPLGLDKTGNPIFCTLWTYLGLPAITLPLLSSEAGMPIGVQLVGRYGNDARLLRTANWLAQTLGGKPKRRKR
jgi:Asp-tRNA(Asn)/Glu-tRNA(Gln) amidotransferase A subunit family amidase